MKIARFFAVIFACIGVVLLVGSMGFFLLNRNAQVRIREIPQGAVSSCDSFVQALNDGDLEGAAQMMYGQPDLGVGDTPENPETILLWDAFCGSIAVEMTGEWSLEQTAFVRSGTITNLDVAALLGKLPERTQALLEQRVAAAESLADIYDEENDFREDLVEEILKEALNQTLTQDAQLVTREITLKFVNQDGTWWVLPDQNLLQILSGLA